MSITVCVCDYWHDRRYFEIKHNNEIQLMSQPKMPALHGIPDVEQKQHTPSEQKVQHLERSAGGKESAESATKKRRLCQLIDAISAFYLLRELTQQTRFRQMLAERLNNRSVQLLWLQLVPPAKDIIDYKFNRMLMYDVWTKIEIEYLMSWLSTLGGGFSALGEHFERCAETAGKISLKQLAIGMRLGDPFLQARCRLFFSISLIQRGHLRAAKHIIREQYTFASKYSEHDERLVKMCHGIWLRLRFEYAERLSKRQALRANSSSHTSSNQRVLSDTA